MAILGLQRQAARAGRIRLGETVSGVSKSGKTYTRPAKLDTFRFTSASRHAIESVAHVLGGTVSPWEQQGQQWQRITELDRVPVLIPPGPKVIESWMEMWAPGMCVRRCDRVTETLTGSPCLCPADEDARAAKASRGEACRMTTRVSVVVPDLIGVGTWMLESHGFYAATELPGVAEMLAAYAERGVMVPAELRIEQRQRRIYRGEGAAPEQRSYPVPVLDVLATVREIQQAAVEGRKFAGALPAPLVPRKALAAGPAPRAIEDRVRADAESESAAQSLAGDALAARDVDALRGVWDMAVQAGVVDEFVTVPHYQELISLSDVIAEHKKAILAGAVA